MRSDGGQKKPDQKNPEGKKCGQEIWVGTKAQAQSPSYGTLQCNRKYVAPKNNNNNKNKEKTKERFVQKPR